MARTEALADGGALIMIAGDPEPELLADLDQARVGKARPVDAANRQLLAQNERQVNWTIAAFPTEGQAQQMFGEPDVERLWDAVADSVRLKEADPVEAWRRHVARLAARCDQLNAAAFDAIRFTGPGTDLTVGLDPGLPLVRRQRDDRRRHRARGQSPDRRGLQLPRLAADGGHGPLDAAALARRARSSAISRCGSRPASASR